MLVFYLATLLKGRGIGEEGGDQEERQGSGEGGGWRSIVVQYLSNDITVCSSFILANETMIFFFFII